MTNNIIHSDKGITSVFLFYKLYNEKWIVHQWNTGIPIHLTVINDLIKKNRAVIARPLHLALYGIVEEFSEKV